MPKGVRAVRVTLPRPFAVRADLGGRALGAAGALALVAGFDLHNVQLAADAEAGLFKADLYLGADVLAAHGGVRRTLRAAEAAEAAAETSAKAAAEEIVQNVGKAAEALGARLEAGRIERGEAVLVVLRALIGVGEHLVGLVDLFELLLALLVAGVQVGVEFLRLFPVGFLYVVGTGALVDTKYLIIIAFIGHIAILLTWNAGGPEIRPPRIPLIGTQIGMILLLVLVVVHDFVVGVVVLAALLLALLRTGIGVARARIALRALRVACWYIFSLTL